jgi:hypothetical protein
MKTPSQSVLGNAKSKRTWKRQVEAYFEATGATEKSKKVQTAVILNCAGPHVLKVYDNFLAFCIFHSAFYTCRTCYSNFENTWEPEEHIFNLC